MPTPISSQAANIALGPGARPRPARPRAKTTLLAPSTGRPPQRSIARPANGPSAADTSRASENAANTVGTPTPRSRAIGVASIAGR